MKIIENCVHPKWPKNSINMPNYARSVEIHAYKNVTSIEFIRSFRERERGKKVRNGRRMKKIMCV